MRFVVMHHNYAKTKSGRVAQGHLRSAVLIDEGKMLLVVDLEVGDAFCNRVSVVQDNYVL